MVGVERIVQYNPIHLRVGDAGQPLKVQRRPFGPGAHSDDFPVVDPGTERSGWHHRGRESIGIAFAG
jgi:hypothetical protein